MKNIILLTSFLAQTYGAFLAMGPAAQVMNAGGMPPTGPMGPPFPGPNDPSMLGIMGGMPAFPMGMPPQMPVNPQQTPQIPMGPNAAGQSPFGAGALGSMPPFGMPPGMPSPMPPGLGGAPFMPLGIPPPPPGFAPQLANSAAAKSKKRQGMGDRSKQNGRGMAKGPGRAIPGFPNAANPLMNPFNSAVGAAGGLPLPGMPGAGSVLPLGSPTPFGGAAGGSPFPPGAPGMAGMKPPGFPGPFGAAGGSPLGNKMPGAPGAFPTPLGMAAQAGNAGPQPPQQQLSPFLQALQQQKGNLSPVAGRPLPKGPNQPQPLTGAAPAQQAGAGLRPVGPMPSRPMGMAQLNQMPGQLPFGQPPMAPMPQTNQPFGMQPAAGMQPQMPLPKATSLCTCPQVVTPAQLAALTAPKPAKAAATAEAEAPQEEAADASETAETADAA